MNPSTSPSLEAALGAEGWRIHGIESWEDVAAVGLLNLRALQEWTQEAATRAFADQDREQLAEVTPVVARLAELEAVASERKPLLPRLRRESFRVNERVAVYVGELPGATSSWAFGVVSAVAKAFNPQWQNMQANSGYYWRVTALLERGAPPRFAAVSFSTSEPRAIPEQDLIWLRRSLATDRRFVDIFSVNSRRAWQPLWCLEASVPVDVDAMDMAAWIAAVHP